MKKMKKYHILPLFILVLAGCFASCDIINPEEEIPAYIAIDTFMLSTNTSTEGPNNHNITDAWISVNGDFVGVFELPCKIPVLNKGMVDLFVKPGIKNNGIASSRLSYPFYSNYSTEVELTELEVQQISPTVDYYQETIFDWFENFSEQGNSLDTIAGSTVDFKYTTYNGSKAGLIELVDEDDFFRAQSIDSYQFPNINTPVLYFEMDYITNNPFTVGIYMIIDGQINVQPLIFINPIDHWNKIYIDLSYYSQTTYYADEYRVYIEAAKSDTIERAEIILDNLKLLHF